jgi:hypothetical protein
MGTATFSISKYGVANPNVRGRLVTSGSHTTTTTASSLTDGAAGGGSAVSGNAGDVLTIRVDEAARIKFGGQTATATDGLIVFADETADLEVSGAGTISIIDVA